MRINADLADRRNGF